MRLDHFSFSNSKRPEEGHYIMALIIDCAFESYLPSVLTSLIKTLFQKNFNRLYWDFVVCRP